MMSDASKTARKIWAEVTVNRLALEGCSQHQFASGPVQIGQRVQCLKCGGQLRLSDLGQYIQGWQARGGDPNDIFPGWMKGDV